MINGVRGKACLDYLMHFQKLHDICNSEIGSKLSKDKVDRLLRKLCLSDKTKRYEAYESIEARLSPHLLPEELCRRMRRVSRLCPKPSKKA
jgi:hypothetical protein